MSKDRLYFTSTETLDFKPAPAGWTVHYFNHDEPGTFTCPLAGWTVEASTICHSGSGVPLEDQPPLAERTRTIAPADMGGDGYMEDPRTCGNFWRITGPGHGTWTDAEVKQAWHEWKAAQ